MTTPSPQRPGRRGETITVSDATLLTVDVLRLKPLPPRLANRRRKPSPKPPAGDAKPGEQDRPSE